MQAARVVHGNPKAVVTGSLHALPSLYIRPLALSASVAEALVGGAPVVQAGHRHGAILALPGTADSVFMSAPGRGLLPAHIVVRDRDLARVLDALADAQTGTLRLRIDAAEARIFRLVLRPDSADLQCARARAGIAALAQSLRASATPLGLGVTAAEALAPGSRWSQYAAAVQNTEAAAESALRSLIGFGAGTTPAGDDFIVGMLAHAWATRGHDAPAIATMRMLGPALPELTTAVSATYLRAAARGDFGSHLIAWVRALPHTSASRALALAKRVAEHGATSGYDTLAGFVAAAESVHASRRVRLA